jgi:hypothetical protein
VTTINTEDMKDDEQIVQIGAVPFMRTTTISADAPWLFYDHASGKMVERWDDHELWADHEPDEPDDAHVRLLCGLWIAVGCVAVAAVVIWYGVEYFTGV